jgi:hypothetical protein
MAQRDSLREELAERKHGRGECRSRARAPVSK